MPSHEDNGNVIPVWSSNENYLSLNDWEVLGQNQKKKKLKYWQKQYSVNT